jgi:transcriptional regulator with XRE-family HTH domain
VNTTRLIAAIKRRDPSGKEKVAIDCGISASYLEKIVTKQRVPALETMDEIARAVREQVDDLFPVSRKTARKTA